MIRVVLVEDQGMVRGALAALLGTEPGLAVVGDFGTGAAALDAMPSLGPDVLVTDVEMPGMNGIELCAAARRALPQLRVVVLTTFARAGYLKRALAAGASAYVLKDAPAATLAAAIRGVRAGQRIVDPELAAEAVAEPDPLTVRERQVLRAAESGASTETVARVLGLSEGTVRNYLSSAIGKLGAKNRTEAAALARAKGWL
ncbi:MAG: response regulator transcription factor [Nannocystaceae bacterium]|nr:response regulator transcription factor [Nannocystaceae bacterium]